MLESTQAVADGTEEPGKNERTILIPTLMSAQVAIARLVTLRPHEVQPFDQALQRLEILQAVDVFRAYLAASCGHGSHYGNVEPRAQLGLSFPESLDPLAHISCRTGVGRERYFPTQKATRQAAAATSTEAHDMPQRLPVAALLRLHAETGRMIRTIRHTLPCPAIAGATGGATQRSLPESA